MVLVLAMPSQGRPGPFQSNIMKNRCGRTNVRNLHRMGHIRNLHRMGHVRNLHRMGSH